MLRKLYRESPKKERENAGAGFVSSGRDQRGDLD